MQSHAGFARRFYLEAADHLDRVALGKLDAPSAPSKPRRNLAPARRAALSGLGDSCRTRYVILLAFSLVDSISWLLRPRLSCFLAARADPEIM